MQIVIKSFIKDDTVTETGPGLGTPDGGQWGGALSWGLPSELFLNFHFHHSESIRK